MIRFVHMIFFLKALSLGLLASLAVYSSMGTGLPTWILFMGWTSYYLFGSRSRTVFESITQQMLGVLLAVFIVGSAKALENILSYNGLALSVAFAVTGVSYVSKLKSLNNLPAYFIGMIIWFGLNEAPNFKAVSVILVALICGNMFGFTSDFINRRIESFKKEQSCK